MPVIYHKEEKNFRIGIWKMDEEVEDLLNAGMLSEKDLARVTAFKSIARMKEWICTRLLLRELLPEQNASIVYDENGKPFLHDSSAHISVSHTKEFVGVIISEKYSVGIDLELIHPRIEKIVPRFVSDDEMNFVDKKKPLEYYFLIWKRTVVQKQSCRKIFSV
jgi:4'-phosphopantetheinyl transferase